MSMSFEQALGWGLFAIGVVAWLVLVYLIRSRPPDSKIMTIYFNANTHTIWHSDCNRPHAPPMKSIHIDQENTFEYEVPSDHTAMLYVLEGEGYFDSSKEKLVDHDNLVVFEKGNRIRMETKDNDLRFLLMTGKPINEPVAWQGPIVMNTQAELRQAFSELNTGNFIKHEYRN